MWAKFTISIIEAGGMRGGEEDLGVGPIGRKSRRINSFGCSFCWTKGVFPKARLSECEVGDDGRLESWYSVY